MMNIYPSPTEPEMTPLQEFYSGANIFLTGGTGFLGKSMLQKLLTSCPGIDTIYVLVRNKKGKDFYSRVEELFDDPVFDVMKKKVPKFRHKIQGIPGDCLLPGLGISQDDRKLLSSKVNIVFHMAATVRFDEQLRIATKININAIVELIHLCNEMSNLKSILHISTAYSNCPRSKIEEKFYPPPIDSLKMLGLVDSVSDKLLDKITPIILEEWPNTYTFTKAIAEDVIKKLGSNLPIGMLRPGIITSSYLDPCPGWIDNFYGPTGLVAGIGTGIIRSIRFQENCDACLVPVDLCANSIIAAAWDVQNKFKTRLTIEPEIPIYNFCTSKKNNITWGKFNKTTAKYGEKTPTMKAIWCVSYSNYPNKYAHFISLILLHYLPAVLIDAFAVVVGKKPRLVNTYKKIHNVMKVLDFFSVREWDFSINNTEALWEKLTPKDKEIFLFDMKKLNWEEYFKTYFIGIRSYLLNDPNDTLPEALSKLRKFYWIHQSIKFFISAIFLRTIWSFFSLFFK